MRVRDPGTLGPEAKTRVPCPCCGKGMVLPERAAIVKAALRDEADPDIIHTSIVPPKGE